MIRFPERLDPLLPRPMSICNVFSASPAGRRHLQILHKVVGRGTALLSRLVPGNRLRVLGPLGTPFVIPAPKKTGSKALLIAGGIGIAIFPLLATALKAKGWSMTLLSGARSGDDLVNLSWFRDAGVEVRTATEDGSMGARGLVTDLLNDVLSSPESAETAFACGPAPMLRAVARIVNDARVPCQLSLESFMACGIGACLGCVVRIRQGSDWSYARVCVEGPTLDAKEVVWD